MSVIGVGIDLWHGIDSETVVKLELIWGGATMLWGGDELVWG